jgi:hypothetical protein
MHRECTHPMCESVSPTLRAACTLYTHKHPIHTQTPYTHTHTPSMRHALYTHTNTLYTHKHPIHTQTPTHTHTHTHTHKHPHTHTCKPDAAAACAPPIRRQRLACVGLFWHLCRSLLTCAPPIRRQRHRHTNTQTHTHTHTLTHV